MLYYRQIVLPKTMKTGDVVVVVLVVLFRLFACFFRVFSYIRSSFQCSSDHCSNPVHVLLLAVLILVGGFHMDIC